MLRKLLGSLLIVSWVILSGFDLVEDLELPKRIEIRALPDASLPIGAPGLHALNNIVESADHKPESYACLLDLHTVDSSAGGIVVFKKVSRLHKLHRVYLI
jgi:hypothetical protein